MSFWDIGIVYRVLRVVGMEVIRKGLGARF